MSKNITVGIDIGSHSIRVMVVEHIKNNDRGSVRIIGNGFAESRGVRHGYIVNTKETASALSQAVRQAEQASGVRFRNAIISVGGVSLASHISTGATIISKADNEVTFLDIEKALKDAENRLSLPNKHIIETIPLEYKLDGKVILGRPEGMKGIKLEVTVLYIACLKQHLDDLVSVVNDIGIDVVDIIPTPLASSLVTLSEKQKMAGCMLLDIGSDTVSALVFEDNNPISLHVFSLGSTDITNDIALGLKIPLQEAEDIKQGAVTGNIPKEQIETIIEARMTDIFELVQKYLKKMKRDGLLPAGVVVLGGGSQIPITEQLARKILNIPAVIPTLPTNSKKTPLLKDAGWFAVYGLCVANRHPHIENREKNPLLHIFTPLKHFFASIIKQLKP